jgi:hypothetical protein
LKAYHVTVIQELKPLDTQKRMAYCEWFMNLFGEDDELLDMTWYSDEAWFHLSGYVISQNKRIWATENSHEMHEVPLQSPGVAYVINMKCDFCNIWDCMTIFL